MNLKIIYKFIMLLILLTNVGSAIANSQTSCDIMPEDLIDIAKEMGFRQIENFYNRPAILKPPFVFGISGGALKEKSVAFWVESITLKNTYYLIVIEDTFNRNNDRADVIKWTKSYPGGLSIYSNIGERIDNFHSVNNPEKLPKSMELTHNAILSEYDGVELLFYSHKGEWFVSIKH